MSVKLTTNASHLYRARARLATELGQLPEITDEPVHFDITPEQIGISTEGTSSIRRAGVQNTQTTSIPSRCSQACSTLGASARARSKSVPHMGFNQLNSVS